MSSSSPPSYEEARTLADHEKKLDGTKEGVPPTEATEVQPASSSSSHDQDPDDDSRYVTGRKLFLIFVGFLSSIFLVSLDQTIVSTALPVIVSRFDALSQVTWVVSAYFLTQAGFMLTAGQFLTLVSTKWVYIVAITLFEIGSLICGVAPSINVLILGRAVAGMGGACIFVSILSTIAQITRLKDRPLLFGAFGSVFALASVVGPLLGGAFTDHVSWRWCFYINLPFGALSIGTIVIWLPAKPPIEKPEHKGLTTLQKFIKVDWIGTILCLGMVCSLLLPLQWAGQTKPWNDKSVIALLCVFAVMLPIFIGWEYYMGTAAILPLKLFKVRTQVGTCLAAFFVFLGLLVAVYYLPLWYQVQGASATKSGIDILPFQISTVLSAMLVGAVINFTGRYWPWLIGTPLLIPIACGLLFSITEFTPHTKLIGYQILFGIGIGGVLQNSVIAVQAEYAEDEAMVPQATSLVSFAQLIGGIIGIAIAGNVFANGLNSYIPEFAPGLPPEIAQEVRESVEVIFQLPESIRPAVVHAYVKAIDRVFLIGIPSGAIASVAAIFIKNYNLKERSGMSGGAMAA